MSHKIQIAVAAVAVALSLAAPAAHAMRVVKDAVTGELRAPNAVEAAAFEKAEAQLRASKGAAAGGRQPARVTGVETRYPDGTVETSMGEDTHMYSVVSTTAEGALQMDCVPAQEAHKLMQSSSKKSSPAKSGASSVKAGHVH